MSSSWTPCRAEVMTWTPQQLSEYLSTLNLSGSDKAVLRNSISGSRFVNLSDNDLQRFPRLHIPMISKISNEINKKEKRGLFEKKPVPRYPPTETPKAEGWGDDEFDDVDGDDDDEDYERPFSADEDEDDGDYESPNDDEGVSSDYEPPPSEHTEETKLYPTVPVEHGDYIDNRPHPPPVCPRPQPTHQPGTSPHVERRPFGNFPPEPPPIQRHDKPGRTVGSNPSPVRGFGANTAGEKSNTWRIPSDVLDSSLRTKAEFAPPFSSSVTRSNSSITAAPNRFDSWREQTQEEANKRKTFPLPNKKPPPQPRTPDHGDGSASHSARTLPDKLPSAIKEPQSVRLDTHAARRPLQNIDYAEDLDPRWFVGTVTRGHAERCLRHLKKDGVYLVRNSTHQRTSQPFTLMVFYHNKVYNIQIRHEQQLFLLGTGLKGQEGFHSVGDIVRNYSQCPLQLIDAKNRTSAQCVLTEPAGGHMTADL